MKRKANGYGSVSKLSGNRRRPWVAYTAEKKVRGKRIRGECIGYFETYEEAEIALAQYNKTKGSKINYTLNQLYDEWSKKAYKSLSKSTVDCYKAAFKNLAELHSMKVREIRSGHFQEIIDSLNGEISTSSLRKIKILAGILEKYAMSYDIIEKNYAEFVEIPTEAPKEKEIFSEDDLKKLEKAADENFMQSRLVLILLYTGLRVTELLLLKPSDFDSEAMTITGGIKTENGKNRTVPIPPRIQGYFIDELNKGGETIISKNGRQVSSNYFREHWFKPTLKALNILRADGKPFTPHVCRHTYISILRKQGADPLVIKKLVGHSPTGDVTEKVYTHVDLDMLNAAVELLKKK